MTLSMIDPRIHPGAYISRGLELWLVLGPERENGCVTGKYELENARGVWSSYGNGKGAWLHKRIALTSTEIRDTFEMARPALTIDHLDKQMDEHVKASDLSQTC